MRKRILSIIVSCFFVFTLAGNALAINDLSDTNTPRIEGSIDPEIYEMVEAYKNGTFIERNESSTMEGQGLFDAFGLNNIQESDGIDVDCIYDIKATGNDTYEATRVAFVSLEKEDQGTVNGVILFCRIVYVEKTFNDPWANVMLKQVKGGVVQNNGNYWCEALYMKYDVHGLAYDANGNDVGYKSSSVGYGGSVYAPEVGTTYYISGPNDYYYNMGAFGSYVVGYVKGTISLRLSSRTTELEVPCSIEPVV